MNNKQWEIYINAFKTAIAALDAAFEYRVNRTKANARASDIANHAVREAAKAASMAKAALEYGEAYERLEEAACCAELVWRALAMKQCNRMTRKDYKQWADKIRANLETKEAPKSTRPENT